MFDDLLSCASEWPTCSAQRLYCLTWLSMCAFVGHVSIGMDAIHMYGLPCVRVSLFLNLCYVWSTTWHSSLTATPLTRWNRTILLRNISLKAKIKNSRSCHMRSGAGYTFAVFVQVKEPFGSWNKIYDNIGNMLFRIGTFILEVKKKFNSRPYNRISAPLSKGVFFSKFSTSSSVLCYIGVSPANT